MALDKKSLNPLLKWLWDMLSFYSVEEIVIPSDFHTQVAEVKDSLTSDTSGLVNSILDFAIDCATVNFTIETEKAEFQNVISDWFSKINISLLGRIPVGINGLAKEYYRERWKNSSLIVLRTADWKQTKVGNTSLLLPQKMWFVDGENIVIEDGDDGTRVIGEEKYYIKITDKKKKPIPASDNELIFIQKPFDSWSSLYPTPFLMQRGVWKTLELYDLVNKKAEKFVGKALEYLLLFKKGTEGLAQTGRAEFIYSDEDLKKAKDDLKLMVQNNKSEAGTPVYATNFDTDMSHFVPDYETVLKQGIYSSLEKRILSGLGMVEIIEGVATTRREAILNPKPFIAEVETGITDFISLISDVILTIKEKNANSHPKYVNEKIELHYPSIKYFLVDSVRDHIRSMYDRGIISKRTYVEVIGEADFDIEIDRRKIEKEKNLDEVMYPPIIQNREDIPDVFGPQPKTVTPKKEATPNQPKNTTEKLPEEKTGPEAKNYRGDIEPYDGTDTEFVEALEEFSKIYEEAPYKTNKELPPAVKKYPSHAQDIFRNAFNNALKHYKNEQTAFKVAWSALKSYVNKGEIKNE